VDQGAVIVSPLFGIAWGYSWAIAVPFWALIYVAARMYSPAASAIMRSPAEAGKIKSPGIVGREE
jgi:hypothetical protein